MTLTMTMLTQRAPKAKMSSCLPDENVEYAVTTKRAASRMPLRQAMGKLPASMGPWRSSSATQKSSIDATAKYPVRPTASQTKSALTSSSCSPLNLPKSVPMMATSRPTPAASIVRKKNSVSRGQLGSAWELRRRLPGSRKGLREAACILGSAHGAAPPSLQEPHPSRRSRHPRVRAAN
ncbi:unnamed protein product [Prorocentrum cordatum]|uniref:Uncharacterized protein n=1 Tax=Prorocentrum cordatum TaxID=2364126 RepID=A0ABN9TL16_9DINO|nr:unnamed protein product [Polarella glacialis]